MPKNLILKRLTAPKLPRPVVVGTLTGSAPFPPQILNAKNGRIDIIEVRLDTFPFLFQKAPRAIEFSKELLSTIKRKTNLPLLLTLRSYKESGKRSPRWKKLNNSARLQILKPLLPLVNLVDAEIRQLEFAKPLTSRAHQLGVGVVHSFHDFKTCPPLSRLDRHYSLSKRMKGDFFKAAVRIQDDKQLGRFLEWGLNCKKPRPVLIGMGPAGEISRFAGFSFGSVMTFGHLGSKTAPGQPPVRKLSQFVRAHFQ